MSNATTIVKLTAETNQYEKNIKNAQKTFNDFTKSMGVSMKQFTAVGLAIGAVTTAVKVVGDAFKQNELIVDEWGRTMDSAKSLYKGFLNALNTGDISGYLHNINQIVSAAREAYDAMDKLGTFDAFNQMNEARLRNNLQSAINNYREGTGSKASVDIAAGNLKDLLRARQDRQRDAYEKAVGNVAAQRKISKQDLLDILESPDIYEWENVTGRPMTGTKGGLKFEMGPTGPNLTWGRKTVAANEYERLGQIARMINDNGVLDELQAKGRMSFQTGIEIEAIDRQVMRALGQGTTRRGGGGGAAAAAAKAFVMPQLQMAGLGEGATGTIADALTIPDSVAQANEEFFRNNYIQMKNMEAEAMRVKETWNLVADSLSTVGGALAGLEDPTARIAGTLMQAVATLALSYAEAVEKAAKLGPIAWTAFAATGLATLLTTTTTIKGITKGGFADGGIIPGNYYGDQLSTANYGLSSGELILNKAQQGNLASQLAAGAGRMQLSAVISGEQIRLVLNNNGRRTGRGEYVTTNIR